MAQVSLLLPGVMLLPLMCLVCEAPQSLTNNTHALTSVGGRAATRRAALPHRKPVHPPGGTQQHAGPATTTPPLPCSHELVREGCFVGLLCVHVV
jgi:hypothetical protein